MKMKNILINLYYAVYRVIDGGHFTRWTFRDASGDVVTTGKYWSWGQWSWD